MHALFGGLLGLRYGRTKATHRKVIVMLSLTEGATTAVRQIVAGPGLPPDAGLRISAAVTEDQQGVLELSVVGASEATDQVVGEQGAQVFVDQQIAPLLEDKTLDATMESGQIKFMVVEETLES